VLCGPRRGEGGHRRGVALAVVIHPNSSPAPKRGELAADAVPNDPGEVER